MTETPAIGMVMEAMAAMNDALEAALSAHAPQAGGEGPSGDWHTWTGEPRITERDHSYVPDLLDDLSCGTTDHATEEQRQVAVEWVRKIRYEAEQHLLARLRNRYQPAPRASADVQGALREALKEPSEEAMRVARDVLEELPQVRLALSVSDLIVTQVAIARALDARAAQERERVTAMIAAVERDWRADDDFRKADACAYLRQFINDPRSNAAAIRALDRTEEG